MADFQNSAAYHNGFTAYVNGERINDWPMHPTAWQSDWAEGYRAALEKEFEEINIAENDCIGDYDAAH